MIRTLRGVVGCLCLSFAMISVYGTYGCGSKCATDADCTTGQKCDTATGACGEKTKVGCASDADCGASGKVCDTGAGKNGKCFDECTDDSSCSEGNKCETTLKRCVCVKDECAKRSAGGGAFSCHPVTNQCEPECANDDACENGEKCQAKHCLNPNDVDHKCNDSDKKCGDNEKCDTAQIPNICVATGPKPCTDDDSCKGNPAGELCDVSTSKCVACLDDVDCTGANEECTTEGTCEAKKSCTSNKECFDATPGTYCGDKTGPCKTAELSCTADNQASGNDAWTANIKDKKGAIIWKAEAKLLTDAKSCLDLPSGAAKCTDTSECGQDEVCSKLGSKCLTSCKSDSDCESGESCNADWGDLKGIKGCVVGIPNGTVEVKFSFYHPAGKFKTGQDKKGDIVKIHGAGGIATKLTIESGDQTEGTAQFSFCEKGASGKSFSFYVKDTDGNPSNAACYTAK